MPAVFELVGIAATLHRVALGAFDPVANTRTNTASDVAVTVTPPSPFESRYVDGDAILATDAQVLIDNSAGAVTTPRPEEALTVNGLRLNVVRTWPIVTGTLTPAYLVQLRSP